METLGDALPREQARVRELLGIYKSIGPAGMFAATLMEESLRRADKAVMSGDPVEIIKAYEDLKAFEA